MIPPEQIVTFFVVKMIHSCLKWVNGIWKDPTFRWLKYHFLTMYIVWGVWKMRFATKKMISGSMRLTAHCNHWISRLLMTSSFFNLRPIFEFSISEPRGEAEKWDITWCHHSSWWCMMHMYDQIRIPHGDVIKFNNHTWQASNISAKFVKLEIKHHENTHNTWKATDSDFLNVPIFSFFPIMAWNREVFIFSIRSSRVCI